MRGIEVEPMRRSRGITLPELLVVVSIIALAVTVAVPLITDAVRAARVRTATDEFAVSLMAARMLAVTHQAPVDVAVAVDPDNYFEYPNRNGVLQRYDMPVGVRIVSSTNPIVFQPNGMVEGGATTTIEARGGGGDVETWDIETSILGVAKVTRRSEP
jgi:prepilin-type N-terminal cleavage/methylation domain-containing protein